jgi:phosphoribosyl 1,2-cyclic phosphodiesterase/CheY-like chemotaxis protein
MASDGSPRRLFYVIDDNPELVELLIQYLTGAGHRAVGSTSTARALEEIVRLRPDCVLVDLLMPELDGMTFFRRLRQQPDLERTKIVIVTGKPYDFDRRRALELGADGYIQKPVRLDIVPTLEAILADRIELAYWGVRGTLPVPGRRSLRYGGNTSCVSLAFGDDARRLFVFDGGSGIKPLSDHLLATTGGRGLTGRIFISHPHWDHINALPFFVPFYLQGNEFEILGAAHGDLSMRDLISAQMGGVYFPITMREFAAQVRFRNLGEETLHVDGTEIRTMMLSHPGTCLGYRVTAKGKSICYVTDNELFPAPLPQRDERYRERLVEFVRDADILITDTTYTDEGYTSKVGWGHSAVGEVVELAHRGNVKELHLFHHDPDQSDDDVDGKLAAAQRRLRELSSATRCRAPAEGDRIAL